jgi:hypothetical protein
MKEGEAKFIEQARLARRYPLFELTEARGPRAFEWSAASPRPR